MKTYGNRLWVPFVFWFVILNCAASVDKSDTEFSSQLVGSWKKVRHQPAGTSHKDVFVTFRSDHSLLAVAIVKFAPDLQGRMEYIGRWRVENGRLVERITKATVTPILLREARNQLVSVTPGDFVMIGQDSGEEIQYQKGTLPRRLPPLLPAESSLFFIKPRSRSNRPGEITSALPRPSYPDEARRGQMRGKGLFGLVLDSSTGNVKSIHVLISTGHQILDDATRKTLIAWRFKPGVETALIPMAFTTSGYQRMPPLLGPQFWSDSEY